MLKFEEYIKKRKAEDGINEFDSSQKMNNIRTCIDYIFEYYDQYLPIQGVEKRTVAENEKLHKYEKTLRGYSENIIEWLVSIYDTYDKQINKSFVFYLDSVEGFYMMYDEADFRSVSYDCYAALVNRLPFLKNQTQILYQFIREYHIKQTSWKVKYDPKISDEITNWIENTLMKYNVSITAAVESYLLEFRNNPSVWAPRSRLISDYSLNGYNYNYKTKTNIFNINTFYTKYSDKPFIKGYKDNLEMTMMYFWLHNIDGNKTYWDEYLNNKLNKLDEK